MRDWQQTRYNLSTCLSISRIKSFVIIVFSLLTTIKLTHWRETIRLVTISCFSKLIFLGHFFYLQIINSIPDRIIDSKWFNIVCVFYFECKCTWLRQSASYLGACISAVFAVRKQDIPTQSHDTDNRLTWSMTMTTENTTDISPSYKTNFKNALFIIKYTFKVAE